MKEFGDMKHFHMLKTMYTSISTITQNSDIDFFKIMSAYELTKVAGMMHTRIISPAYGKHTVNFYAMNLAPSGYGLKKPTF